MNTNVAYKCPRSRLVCRDARCSLPRIWCAKRGAAAPRRDYDHPSPGRVMVPSNSMHHALQLAQPMASSLLESRRSVDQIEFIACWIEKNLVAVFQLGAFSQGLPSRGWQSRPIDRVGTRQLLTAICCTCVWPAIRFMCMYQVRCNDHGFTKAMQARGGA